MQKQPNSQMCFVCGLENPIGLKASFYEDEDGRVTVTWTPGEEHQGYPGLLHGGIAAALLDEALGRTVIGRDLWLVTAKMEIRYRNPIPIGEPLTVVAELTRVRSRIVEARGELRLSDGRIGAEANAVYVRLPEERKETMMQALAYWKVVPDD
ncbi:MAG: PaaI family thioesterase [Chloroflexi bacterium]|nr:MAG: PaaI family thioesterase [Chloroflexota bacterium]